MPTSLAVFWGEDLWQRVERRRAQGRRLDLRVHGDEGHGRSSVSTRWRPRPTSCRRDFGKWQTPWGDINRFQRNNGDIVQKFDDAKPSTPVMFTSARWGSLASFGARAYPGTKKWYGTSGNSFVAVVEFGDQVKAKAVTAGGLNSDPTSPHFNDQAERYATGNLRDVYFYRPSSRGTPSASTSPGE